MTNCKVDVQGENNKQFKHKKYKCESGRTVSSTNPEDWVVSFLSLDEFIKPLYTWDRFRLCESVCKLFNFSKKKNRYKFPSIDC